VKWKAEWLKNKENIPIIIAYCDVKKEVKIVSMLLIYFISEYIMIIKNISWKSLNTESIINDKFASELLEL